MLINRQLGDYLLVRRLAVGGQSEVFLALKQGPGAFSRPLVLKAMPSKYREDTRFLQLFYQEAFVSARFSHPNVISIHDAKKVGAEHFMVMDFVSGQTVSDLAQRSYQADKALTINQVVQIVADASAGLHYAHAFEDVDERTYSVIHCDVSPQNLMVTYDGITKVFDFGIARVIGDTEQEIPSIGGGKYAYMSPEQVRGESVDARSDIFSLGIILFELCTGYRLFRRPTRPEVINAVLEDEIPRPGELSSDIPLFLEQCILKALARNPDERYQTAGDLRDDLLEFVAVNGGHNVHDELGQHVRELFAKERFQIGEILREAAAMEAPSSPLGGVALGELSPGWRRQVDSSMEMEVSMLELLPASDENKVSVDDTDGVESQDSAASKPELSESDEFGVDGTVNSLEAVSGSESESNEGLASEGGDLETSKTTVDAVASAHAAFEQSESPEGEHQDEQKELERDLFQEEFVKITGRSDRTADFVETVELSRDDGENAGRPSPADDYIEMMTGELDRIRRRQRWLVIAIVCLVVVSGSLGLMAFNDQIFGLFAEAAPIQLGSDL